MKKNNLQYITIVSLLFIAVLLIGSRLIFKEHYMPFILIFHQIGWGLLFFLGIFFFYYNWEKKQTKAFIKRLFWVSLLVRIGGVFFYYSVFMHYNEVPFQLINSDELSYHDYGEYFAWLLQNGTYNLLKDYKGDFSDFGYRCFLGIVYAIFGVNIIVVRLFNALFSALTVLYTYKIARFYFNENISRFSGVLIMLTPILIHYSATHMKESLFIFLLILSVYHALVFVNSTNPNLANLIYSILFTVMLFAFRTSTGLIMLFCFFINYFFHKSVNKAKGVIRFILFPASIFLFFYILSSTPAQSELETAQDKGQRYTDIVKQVSRSQNFVKIASTPLFFAISLSAPFPVFIESPLVESDRTLALFLFAIDCIIKGIFSYFVILGLIFCFKDNFKKYIYIIAILVLIVASLAYTGTVLNIRHHLPLYPFFMMFAAVGIFYVSKNQKLYNIFYLLLLIIGSFAYNYLKVKDFA